MRCPRCTGRLVYARTEDGPTRVCYSCGYDDGNVARHPDEHDTAFGLHTAHCFVCEAIIVPVSASVRRQKYCGSSCKNLVLKARKRGTAVAHLPGPTVTRQSIDLTA